MFEMLQQYEDALVQYDELDALFTQYVLNFGAGGTVSSAHPPSMYSKWSLVKTVICSKGSVLLKDTSSVL